MTEATALQREAKAYHWAETMADGYWGLLIGRLLDLERAIPSVELGRIGQRRERLAEIGGLLEDAGHIHRRAEQTLTEWEELSK